MCMVKCPGVRERTALRSMTGNRLSTAS
ncbi:hypothetical protein DSM3645_02708 [Blastopirellula marina DSM 3645]|uniref:Uncharacterized protein n=1 Tax=Blastopirellula marina DSM 3645 TaxID=314230 RepID=A3ZVK5_9BACT|nr:hypothetical protein DSM3645_02708 [Blastopirellula marina DSM 3645]